jgi:aspartate aminotransferase-like enzyme
MNAATLEAMATPTMTARGPEFRKVMAVLNQRLRIAFNLSPSSPEIGTNSWTGEDGYGVIVVSGSGTAAMEMVLSNRFSKSDKILVPTNGKFGERVAQMGDRFADCTHLEGEWGCSFDLQEIEEHLATGEYSALLICHNETSTGITQDAPTLATLAENHGVAFILDGITSVAGLPVHPADWNAEAVVVGAQKCTAGPSGIAAIAVSESFIESCKVLRQSGNGNPMYYFDLFPAVKKADDDQTPWTPAINLALGWATALSELENETLAGRVRRCAHMAQGVRNLFSDLGFSLFADIGCYSDTVTAILYPEGLDDDWRTHLQNEYQTFVIGAQDHMKGKMFRIGSMGNTTVSEMVEGCRRMVACFADFDLDLGEVDVASYFE